MSLRKSLIAHSERMSVIRQLIQNEWALSRISPPLKYKVNSSRYTTHAPLHVLQLYIWWKSYNSYSGSVFQKMECILKNEIAYKKEM
jgi:hypothetical protein